MMAKLAKQLARFASYEKKTLIHFPVALLMFD